MKLNIVDASVAIKWFVDEKNRESALGVLDQIKDSPWQFAVPELFFNEMLSVMCRLSKNTKQINNYLIILQELGFSRLGNGRDTLKVAVELAIKYGLRGYDAIYAANAKLTKGLWLTADVRAHKKIKKLKISQLV